MEHIGEVLGRLPKGIVTPNQKIMESTEPTLEEKRGQLRKSLGISSLENTFENFKPVAGTEKAYMAFKELASGETDWQMLLCYGGVGNGKTHLCEALVIELYKRGVFCRVTPFQNLISWLQRGMRPEAVISYNDLLDRYCDVPRLVIDDVGMAESQSRWEYGPLEAIIVHREREKLFTVLVTNKNLEELPERIVSRFRNQTVARLILNEGEDYRPNKVKRKAK